jgi:acetoacetyl-CoA synthetase
MAPETPRLLWEHPDPTSTSMYKFLQKSNATYNLNLKTFQELYQWSVGANRTDFWDLVFKEINIIHSGTYSKVVDTDARMDSVPRWFEGIKVNFAENVLFTRGPDGENTKLNKEDAKIVTTEVREGGTEIKDFTWGELRRRVGLLANAMRARGVRKGDRVAVVASNSMDTLTVFLAITSLGGIFSSSSTDMGTKGVLDRLRQVHPVWVFVDDYAVYNGKTVDLRPKISDLVNGMSDIDNFEGVVTLPRFENAADLSWTPKTITLASFLAAGQGKDTLRFERTDGAEVMLIVYSSGTTGTPKCIGHSSIGLMMSAMKEGKLHRDLGPDTVVMQYTTTGWIMYLSAVLGLIYGARSVLYDGSPFIGPTGKQDLTAYVKIIADQK